MSAAHELLKEFVEVAPTYDSAADHREHCYYCNELPAVHKEGCLLVRASIEIAKHEGWVQSPLTEEGKKQ